MSVIVRVNSVHVPATHILHREMLCKQSVYEKRVEPVACGSNPV